MKSRVLRLVAVGVLVITPQVAKAQFGIAPGIGGGAGGGAGGGMSVGAAMAGPFAIMMWSAIMSGQKEQERLQNAVAWVRQLLGGRPIPLLRGRGGVFGRSATCITAPQCPPPAIGVYTPHCSPPGMSVCAPQCSSPRFPIRLNLRLLRR